MVFDWHDYLEMSPERADTMAGALLWRKWYSFDRLEYQGKRQSGNSISSHNYMIEC